jgi:hypothetical protein
MYGYRMRPTDHNGIEQQRQIGDVVDMGVSDKHVLNLDEFGKRKIADTGTRVEQHAVVHKKCASAKGSANTPVATQNFYAHVSPFLKAPYARPRLLLLERQRLVQSFLFSGGHYSSRAISPWSNKYSLSLRSKPWLLRRRYARMIETRS